MSTFQNSGAVPHELGVQLLTTLPLAYICVCTYFALFRLNALDYNKLLPRCLRVWLHACAVPQTACLHALGTTAHAAP